MKFGSIKYTAKNGIEIEFRSAVPEEADDEIALLKRVCAETDFLARYEDEINFNTEGEKSFLTQYEMSEKALMLNAYSGDRLIGNCSFSSVGNACKMSHRATMGISLVQEYWNMGIGGKMLSILIEKSKECGFEILELEVDSRNERAIILYEKLGFTESGRLKRSLKLRDGTYADVVLMQRILT